MRLAPASHLPAGLLLAAPALLAAQPPAVAADPVVPPTIDACYVPASGTIYRIDTQSSPAAGAPKACLSASHVKFTWNQQGPAGPAGPPGPKGDPGEPGTAATLGPDLSLPGALTMGKTGTFGGGLLATNAYPLTPPTGAGTRLMWVPQRAALRAGSVTGTQWGLGNVGQGSVALGINPIAASEGSVAIGQSTVAVGANAVALGYGSTASGAGAFAAGNGASATGIAALAAGSGTVASGEYATAIGVTSTAGGSAAVALGAQNTASGANAVALGFRTTASGDFSTALGQLASTSGKAGSFVYGDNSTGAAGTVVQPDADNQFVVRASGGVKLRTTADLSKGCNVDGSGNLTCTGTVNGTNIGQPQSIGPDLTLPGALAMGKTGTFGGGLLATDEHPLAPPSGAGTRAMWVPQKAAFRAGAVNGTQWDLASIGTWSAAFGRSTTASGDFAFAAGANSAATGASAVALGTDNVANGPFSTAIGRRASTEGRTGTFVYGDASTDAAVQATADNQFLVRAAGGVRLRTSSDQSKGCDVDGTGKLGCTGGVSMSSTIFWKIGDWKTVPYQATQVKEESCPTGYTVIGGGVETKDGENLRVELSYPDFGTNRWVAQVGNYDLNAAQMRVRVVCLRS